MQALLLKQQTQTNQQRIQQLICWDELQYGEFVYECGLQYLQALIRDNQEAIAALECSRIFWSWWRNHWAIRDKQFLGKVNIYAPASGILMFYQHYNNPRKLSGRIWPNAVVLHESYARMIGEFNDAINVETHE